MSGTALLDPVEERLRSEAEFQNRRVRTREREPRDRFYYLVRDAFDRYHGELRGLAGKDVLVVGCSADAVPAWLLETARVTGIDIADEAIARLDAWIAAQGLSGQCRGAVMNAEELTFPDASFDAIVCSGVLHHLDVEKASRSFARVLRPGGAVLMLEPMALNPAIALYRAATPSMRTADEHPLLPRDLRTLRSSFGHVEVEAFALLTLLSLVWVWLPDRWNLRERWERALAPVDRALFRVFPWLRYFAWTAFLRCTQPR